MSEQALAPSQLIHVPRGPVPEAPPPRARGQIEIQIDGQRVSVPEGSTILDAARGLGIDTPTLCFLESLTHEQLETYARDRRWPEPLPEPFPQGASRLDRLDRKTLVKLWEASERTFKHRSPDELMYSRRNWPT